MHTTKCAKCGDTFQKETQARAEQALRLHTTRKHPNVAHPILQASRVAAPRGPRVKWTREEEEQLADAATLKRIEDPAKDLSRCLQEAQECLPSDRRRKVQSVSTYPQNIISGIATRLQNILRKSQQPPKEIIRAVTVEKPIDRSLTDVLAECDTGWLIAELIKRLGQEINHLTAALERVAASAAINASHHSGPITKSPPPPPLPAAKTHRQPRVAVVGLTGDEFRELSQQLSGKPIELIFVDRDKPPKTLHAVDSMIISQPAGDPWIAAAEAAVGHHRVHLCDTLTAKQRAYDILSRSQSH